MLKRNDPCWCGSGKKYKKCHLRIDEQNKRSRRKTLNPLVKSAEEIAGMRKAGAFNGRLMDFIRPYVKAGVTTDRLDKLVHEYTLDHGHKPACLGYHGFPKTICTSINEVVCHGIPSPSETLKDGDIVNVDLTTIVDGFYGDSSETFIIGTVPEQAKRLVAVAAKAMLLGIGAVKPGAHLRAIAQAIQPFVRKNGFSVVKDYTGHGIGRNFHEHFSVCHHISSYGDNITMQEGMTFTVEPMINLGGWQVDLDKKDGWTVRTRDRKLSAQFEHTILVTEDGYDILTLTPSQIEAKVPLIVDGVNI